MFRRSLFKYTYLSCTYGIQSLKKNSQVLIKFNVSLSIKRLHQSSKVPYDVLTNPTFQGSSRQDNALANQRADSVFSQHDATWTFKVIFFRKDSISVAPYVA